jgi:anti-sigma regulatory factor (Ser/Thr protein kinase)
MGAENASDMGPRRGRPGAQDQGPKSRGYTGGGVEPKPLTAAVGSEAPVPTLVLARTNRAPSEAREFVADQFRRWEVADDYVGRLVACELVTNAWKHGAGQIVVRVFRDERDGLAVIEVLDQGTGRPVMAAENYTATSGRGLLLMSRLVHDWGSRPLTEGGKIVWAKCDA